MQAVLQLLGTVEEEALFRLCDLVVDRDTAGALTFVEELSEQGHDLGRLVTELIEHLRHLLLVQHMGEVPESLPVTEEARERLRAQANQLGEPTVIRLIDLLAIAVDDMRQGGDPRLPLELALVKVTRPAADLSRESLAYRLEQLEQRGRTRAWAAPRPEPRHRRTPAPKPQPRSRAAGASRHGSSSSCRRRGRARSSLPSREKSIPISTVLGEARPSDLEGDTLTVEFPASASFHRQLAEEPKNATLLRDALYAVTGRKLVLAFARRRGRRRRRGGRSGRPGRRGADPRADEGDLRRTGARIAMSFDMNKLMQQAQQMQEQVQRMQEDAVKEVAESSVGGGLVKVKANGAGQVLSIEISPDAIDPSDAEGLADLVLAGVNEALRSAAAAVEAKAQAMQAELLGGLGLPGLEG